MQWKTASHINCIFIFRGGSIDAMPLLRGACGINARCSASKMQFVSYTGIASMPDAVPLSHRCSSPLTPTLKCILQDALPLSHRIFRCNAPRKRGINASCINARFPSHTDRIFRCNPPFPRGILGEDAWAKMGMNEGHLRPPPIAMTSEAGLGRCPSGIFARLFETCDVRSDDVR